MGNCAGLKLAVHKKRRRKLIWLGVFLAFLIGDYALFPYLASPAGPSVNSGHNALWLRYTWYFGEQPDHLSELLYKTEHHGITDLYFHVRSIQADGSLKYRYLESAQKLNRQLREAAPHLRRFAWIYAGNSSGRGEVNLGSPAVRKRMVGEAKWLVEKCGFDGVQWDYEICPDGDPHLLKLLDETRAALPKAPVSVAVPTWFPAPFTRFGWSPGYFGEVAKRCDQMAVMTYDTAAYAPRLYAALVADQVEVVTKAVGAANPKCSVVMGLPTYEDGTASHNPRAENLRVALIGVRNGLAGSYDSRVWQGVGLFADYTTDDEEWRSFDELWPKSMQD